MHGRSSHRGLIKQLLFCKCLDELAGHLDIGQTIRIDVWTNGHARALHRGALWDVDLAPGGRAEAGVYRIVELQGSRLIVVNT